MATKSKKSEEKEEPKKAASSKKATKADEPKKNVAVKTAASSGTKASAPKSEPAKKTEPKKAEVKVEKVAPAKKVEKKVEAKVEAKEVKAKAEPKKVEAKAEKAKPEPKKVEAKAEKAKAEPKKVEVKAEAKVEKAKPEVKKAEPIEAEPKKAVAKKEVVEEVAAPKPIPSDVPSRYSDEELEMFRTVIVESRSEALDELRMLNERLEDLTNYDFAEESMIYSMHMAEQGSEAMEKEKTYAQIQRIKDYIKKLDEALIRIKDKTYGICRVCGILIAKERLLAVPVTTLSASYKIHQKCPDDGVDRIEPVKGNGGN